MLDKILVGLCLAFFALAGCDTVAEERREAAAEAREHLAERPQDYGEHATMNSVDYFGAYRPEGEDAGAWAVIRLEELGSATVTDNTGETHDGAYQWDVTGTVITLDVDGKVSQYAVGEGFLKAVGGSESQGAIYDKIN